MTQLVPESYFFTEPSETPTQTTSQAFGPIAGNEQTQFRLTAGFTASTDIKAYAICAGQVFLQPHTDSSKVNLVLRPYKQPMKGVPIKYFIYRGLKKADFIPSGNTDLVPHAQLNTATGFIQLIWNQLKGFNGWTDPEADAETFLAKWIGYDPSNQLVSSMLDDYFFMADAYGDENNETLKPFELPLVPRGTELGNFTGNYGLDIVLSEGDYKPLSSDTGFLMDLNFVRASETIIDLSALPTGYVEKQFKEAIGLFMDPAAFWGLHFSNGKAWVKESGSWTKKTGQQIYDTILSKFATKNNVYVNIVGHLGRTYDYYGAYSSRLGGTDVIKLGLTAISTSEASFSTHGWPLLILNTEQDHTDETNSVFLQLVHNPQGTVALYGEVANLTEAAENGFLSSSQLIPEQTVAQDGSIIDNPYTNAIEFVFPAVPATGSLKANVACWNRLVYQGVDLVVLEDVNGTTIEHLVKPQDTLFGPLAVEQRFASSSTEVVAWSYDYEPHLVDVSKIVVGNSTLLGVQTKLISDRLAHGDSQNPTIQSRLIYETQLIGGKGQGVLKRNNPINSSANAGKVPFDTSINNFYLPELPYYLTTENFIDGTIPISGLKLNQFNDEPLNKLFLGVEQQQLEGLLSEISANNLKKAVLFLSPLVQDNSFLSQEGIVYKKFKVGMLAEDSQGNLMVSIPNGATMVYSIDDHCYFSNEFVSEMPVLTEADYALETLVEENEIL